MSLFICTGCGCVENTSCTSPFYNSNDMNTSYPNLSSLEMSLDNMLCSECNTGAWHGEFDKRWPTSVELSMARNDPYNIFTNHPLYRMDKEWSIEEFEEADHNRKYNELNDWKVKEWASCTINSGELNDLSNQQPYVRTVPKIQRNKPCPCGSGLKYKKCCFILKQRGQKWLKK